MEGDVKKEEGCACQQQRTALALPLAGAVVVLEIHCRQSGLKTRHQPRDTQRRKQVPKTGLVDASNDAEDTHRYRDA
jgi:hypothetical protein